MNEDHYVAPQHETRWSCDAVREQIGGWALGALEAGDAAAIERHLTACEQCRQDAARFSVVASLLPHSLPPITPSVEAKRALMSRIAEEQMAVAEAQSQLRPAAPTPVPAPSGEAPARTRTRSHWSQLLIAPLAIALLVMTLWSVQLQDQAGDGGDSDDTDAPIVSMLPNGFQAFTLQSDCQKCASTGKLLANPEQASALMVAWDLDPGEVHQVWCEEGDGSPVLVASLEVNDSGEVVQPLVFDQPIAGYSRIYVMNRKGETSEIRLGEPGVTEPAPDPTMQRQ